MLYTYNTAAQTVAAGAAVVFAGNTQCGCSVTHASGTSAIQINCPGVYKVSFNADGATTDTDGNVGLQVQLNGVAVSGLEASAYSAAAVNVVNIAATGLVTVPPGCCAAGTSLPATLTLVANAAAPASSLTNVGITITKVK